MVAPLLDTPLAYAGRGWLVLPLHSINAGRCSCDNPACPSPGKHPRTSHGVNDATTDEVIIMQWWSRWPAANVGIATGTRSGLLVLDFDVQRRGLESYEALIAEHGDSFARTVAVRTGGGGLHLYLRYPGGHLPCRANVRPGLDVRADGGYVVAPPSVHASGTPYCWAEGLTPAAAELAEVPAWLVELLAQGVPQAEASTAEIPVESLRIGDDMKRLIREGRPNGERSEVLFAVLRAMVVAGFGDETMISVLMNPAHGLSAKPREKGLAWLEAEIRRAREKPNSSGSGGPEAQPNATGNGAESTSTPPSPPGPQLVSLAQVQPQTVTWLFHPYIPRGKVTSIEGDPGVGKSQFTLAISAKVSRGQHNQGVSERVLILTAEDGLADTVRPRLDTFDADLDCIKALDGYLLLNDLGLVTLQRYIAQVQPALVIIDPLVAYVGAKLDLNKANQVRHVMASIARIAEECGCAIVVVRHLTKGDREKALYRGIGSIDITAACRSVLMVGMDPDDDSRRIVAHVKSNLAPLGPSWAFTISNGRFQWLGAATLSAEDLCRKPQDPDYKTKLAEAEDFLRQLLADGAVAAIDGYEDRQWVRGSEMMHGRPGRVCVKKRQGVCRPEARGQPNLGDWAGFS